MTEETTDLVMGVLILGGLWLLLLAAGWAIYGLYPAV